MQRLFYHIHNFYAITKLDILLEKEYFKKIKYFIENRENSSFPGWGRLGWGERSMFYVFVSHLSCAGKKGGTKEPRAQTLHRLGLFGVSAE